jgi:uncharacterized protein (TIGR00725 family)
MDTNNTYSLTYTSGSRGSRHDHLKFKIGVAGASDTGTCGIDALDQAKEIGRHIVRNGGVVLTGAASGFPLWAAMGAKEEKGMVIGLSPAVSEAEHKDVYRMPTEYADLIIYTGFGEPGRDLMFSRSADAIIVGCGRVGTLQEFTVAFQEGKPVGVLEGEGSIAPLVKEIAARGGHPTNLIIFDPDPASLVERIVALVRAQKEKRNTG